MIAIAPTTDTVVGTTRSLTMHCVSARCGSMQGAVLFLFREKSPVGDPAWHKRQEELSTWPRQLG